MKLTQRWAAPTEVQVSVGLMVGIPLIFLGLVLVMLGSTNAQPSILEMPLASLVLGVLVAVGLGLRTTSARPCGYVVVVLFAVLHVFSLLSAQLWWVNVFSGLAAAGYAYAGVLLSSGPLVRFLHGSTR